jgi:glycosyltransferase involved in cell wall biosynthesis
VAIDLAVLGQDPRFGGGGNAQTEAFMDAARALGRKPALLYEPHPGLGTPQLTWRRVEALRQAAGARRLAGSLRDARSIWVCASLAQNGAAAPRSGRRYACWIGTTIASEWWGRAPGLSRTRRATAGASIPVLRRLEQRVLRGAAVLYATSPSSRADVAAAAGRDERDVGVLPIPINPELLVPADEDEWRAALTAPVLTFVGRADDPRKNVSLLLQAFAELRRARPEARLRLVGAPPSSPPPAGVELVGRVTDVASELRRAAIFVLPSRQEGFCIAAAEALAAGLPVIATPCRGPEELLRVSRGGHVLDGFDAGELSGAIAALADSPDEAAAMRAAGRAYVTRIHAPSRFRELVAHALAELDGD